jgi:hypothetical protein
LDKWGCFRIGGRIGPLTANISGGVGGSHMRSSSNNYQYISSAFGFDLTFDLIYYEGISYTKGAGA